jgi:radical SAM protein with 4Fe4S-binding SPASM domain
MNISAPHTVYVDTTRACNLRCRHCYANASVRAKEELTFEEIKSILKECKDMGVFRVAFGGGEPSIRKDFLEILRYTDELGLDANFSTNGTLLTQHIIKQLSEIEALKEVQVSLDGASWQTNDAIRGEGVFYKATETIKNLVAANIYTRISASISKINYSEISDLIDLAVELGVQEFRVTRHLHMGRGEEKIVPEGYRHISKILYEKKQELKDKIHIGSNCFPFLVDSGITQKDENPKRWGCPAGVELCGVTAEGNIVPCIFFNTATELVAGNIRKSKLSEVWRNSEVLWKLRNLNIKGKCEGCGYRSLCRGGCRVVAYGYSKNLSAPDPTCWHTPEKSPYITQPLIKPSHINGSSNYVKPLLMKLAEEPDMEYFSPCCKRYGTGML